VTVTDRRRLLAVAALAAAAALIAGPSVASPAAAKAPSQHTARVKVVASEDNGVKHWATGTLNNADNQLGQLLVDSRHHRVFADTSYNYSEQSKLLVFSENLKLLKTWHINNLTRMVMSPSSKTLLVVRAVKNATRILRIDTSTLRVTGRFSYDNEINSNLVWGGGRIYATISSPKYLSLATLDPAHLRTAWKLRSTPQPASPTYSDTLTIAAKAHRLIDIGGEYMLFQVRSNGGLTLITTNDDAPFIDGAPKTLGFAPGGHRFIVAPYDNQARKSPDEIATIGTTKKTPVLHQDNDSVGAYVGGELTADGKWLVGVDLYGHVVSVPSDQSYDLKALPNGTTANPRSPYQVYSGPAIFADGSRVYFERFRSVENSSGSYNGFSIIGVRGPE
jgi:hypothetical protein